MKFIHISDTHLGYSQYGLNERRNDFLDVFEEAVDFAIDKNVDFIIHSGDFFHTSRPSNQTFLESIRLLERLKERKIPIFTISGNHDRGSQVRDISPLSILEPVGLKVVDTGFIEFDGVFIGGLKYISKAGLKQTNGIRPILESYLEKLPDNGFKILMLHQEFSPLFPASELYLENELPEGFNYVGIGHYHIRQEPKNIKGSTVVYPGSTEFTAYNENEEKEKKGFYLVNVENGKIESEFLTFLRSRPFISIDFDEEKIQETVENLKRDVEKLLDEKRKKPVVIFRGTLKNLELKDLTNLLENSGLNEEKVLHYRFNLSRETEDVSGVSIEGIETDVIMNKLRELIKEEEIFFVVEEAIKSLQILENTDEMKKFLKEHPEILDF